MKRICIISFVLCLIGSLSAYAQIAGVKGETSSRKELLPSWYDDVFRRIACSRVSCVDPRVDGAAEIFVGDTSLHLGVPMAYHGNDTCAVRYDCREIELLAWQERRTLDSSYSTLSALVLVKYVGERNESRWTLMILRQTEDQGWYSWRVSHGYNILRKEWLFAVDSFSVAPTNDQIYVRMDDWAFPEGGYFAYDPADGISTWRGIKFLFVDGDVREKAWEAANGEKPTKFLPGGK